MRDEPLPFIDTVRVPNPSAGADWSYSVPGDRLVRVVGLRAKLTTSATVATRGPVLKITDGTDTYASLPPGSTTAASLAVAHSTVAGCSAIATTGKATTWPCPTDGFVLSPGWTIGTVTDAIDATDQWSEIRLWVVRYQTGAALRLTPDVPYIIEAA